MSRCRNSAAQFPSLRRLLLFVATLCGPSNELDECGYSSSLTSWIIGGQNALPQEFPWLVSLQEYNPNQVPAWQHFCGGSLINEQWVLTAGHCLDISVPWRISLGKHKLSRHEATEVIMSPELHYRHPLYKVNDTPGAFSIDFDFGLVKLSAPLKLSGDHAHLARICLPSANDFSSFDNQTCVATGWGWTNPYRPIQSDVLQRIAVRPVAYELCRSAYGRGALTKAMLCGEPLRPGNVCRGDSGGPLQCLRDGRYVLVGDVSFGSCGQGWTPTVYGRVTEALKWINEVCG